MTAPYDAFLKSLRDGDSESDKMRKLLRAYPSLGKGFTRFRKANDNGDVTGGGDLTVEDLTDEDIDEINEDIGERDEGDDERDDGDGHSGTWAPTDTPASKGSSTSRHVSHLADLVSEATGVERQSTLDWLLHTSRGLTLVRRTLGKRLQKEQTMADSLNKIIADHGLINVAKSIASGGSTGGATEHSLTAAIEVLAKRLYPALTPAQAFATFFSADTPESLACRQAIQKLKRHPVAEAAPRAAAGGAYGELMRKADGLRAANPKMSREQSFAKAYQDNADLAARERRENRPVA